MQINLLHSFIKEQLLHFVLQFNNQPPDVTYCPFFKFFFLKENLFTGRAQKAAELHLQSTRTQVLAE